jgi:hypothetical protein
MTTTMYELRPRSASRSDRERFGDILALQRAAYLRDGAPSLTKRRSDLKKFKAAMLAFFVRMGDVVSALLVFLGTTAGLGAAGFAKVNILVAAAWLAVVVGRRYLRRQPAEAS